MGQLNCTEGDSVQVGPTVVGWVGPKKTDSGVDAGVDSGLDAEVVAVMGDMEFIVRYSYLTDAYWGTPHFSVETNMIAFDMFHCSKRFVVPLPLGSVDVCSDGSLDYTERSAHTVMNAFETLFTALSRKIQADLNSMTPVEAIRKCAELVACRYPKRFGANLTWRGKSLNDISQGTTMKVQAFRANLDWNGASYHEKMYPYAGCWELSILSDEIDDPQVMPSTGFTLLAEWQIRNAYDHKRRSPNNVIHIRADSTEEYEQADTLLFSNDGLVEQYLAKAQPDALDASLFLSMIGDPLEDWVDGEQISVAEFCRLTDEIRKELHQ